MTDADLHQGNSNEQEKDLCLQEIYAEEGKLPNSFYEATITLIPKPDKDATKKKEERNLYTPCIGTSLVVQCLKLCTSNAGVRWGPGLIPGQGTRSHM